MKLTNRDKKLLILLAVVLIAAGFGRLAVWPLKQQIQERSEKQEQLEIEKQAMEMKIAQAPSVKMMAEAMHTDYTNTMSDFYDRLKTQEVDNQITQIILQHNLAAVESSIRISEDPLTVEYYQYSAAALADESENQEEISSSAEEAVAAESGESSESENTEKDGNVFYTAEVSLTVLGSLEQNQSFLDDLTNNYPAIRVTGYSQTEQEENGRATGVFSLRAAMEVYTCDKTVF